MKVDAKWLYGKASSWPRRSFINRDSKQIIAECLSARHIIVTLFSLCAYMYVLGM